MMRMIETALPGVAIIEPEVYRDARGFLAEVYHAAQLASFGIGTVWVQDNHSRSVRNTLRGLHWQYRRPQAKLVRAVRGEIYDVVVDIRRGAPTFGKWIGVHLSADNMRQTFIPEGFAHGFCVLSETADVEYKCSDYYDPGGEGGIPWNDPAVAVTWPVAAPILSVKDRTYEPLARQENNLPTLDSTGRLLWSRSER
jgi:dTDP-4-dehydrorhamnose 3,5-epimerase